jgi:hypothetical protein
MTNPFPFETERHRDEIAPSAIHPTDFLAVLDPALDPDNDVAAGKRWRKVDSTSAPTWFEIYVRNEANSAWIKEGPGWVIAEYAEGDVPIANADGRLEPGTVTGESGPGGPGGPTTVDIEDEGSPEGAADTIDFVGSGVSVTFATGQATVTIPGATGGWTQVINDDASSFAAWTGSSGSWSSDGSIIKQVTISASWKGAYFTTKQMVGAGYIFESKVKIVSGSSGLRAVGLLIGTGTTIPNGGPCANLRNNSGSFLLNIDRFNVDSPYSAAFSFSEDTFYTMRFVCTGGYGSVFIDGTLVASGNLGHNSEATYVALVNYNCEAHYDDIKGYAISLP